MVARPAGAAAAALLAASLLATAPARAQQDAEPAANPDTSPPPAPAEVHPAFPQGTWTLQVENDRFTNADRHYTNGMRLAWVSDSHEHGPSWAHELLQTLYPLAPIRSGRIGFALGHNMYTPENTDSYDLVRDDRPYAGWLYGSVGLQAETSQFGDTDEKRFDTIDSIELSVGVVGPAALGEPVQNEWHDIIGVARANGWSHQLKNEPAVNLAFERRWRPGTYQVIGTGLETDFIPSLGGSLGNVFTQANAGIIFRFGSGLSIDYGPPLIRPSLSPLAALKTGPEFSWYVFAGGSGRAVLRNIFLDGNTFADSHSVDKRPFVGDFLAGFAIVYRDVRVAFTHVMRTHEFEGQDENDRFGALVVSTRF